MADGSDASRVKASLTQLLRERRKLADTDEDNFNVLDTKQLADTLSGTTKVMTMLLGAVAAVSLLVGGIGIMNIMLVSVTERTREIGLRLAIGALEREVLLQFLIEAVVLAALGGVIGIVLATGASIGLAGADGRALPVQPGREPAVVCVFGRHWRAVWLLSGPPRGAHGPDRGAAARIIPCRMRSRRRCGCASRRRSRIGLQTESLAFSRSRPAGVLIGLFMTFYMKPKLDRMRPPASSAPPELA